MLEPERIASIIAADKYSRKKKQARLGQKYYDGEHDILDYRIYYINKEGLLVEDLTKSNIRIPHPFFHEISEQEVAYILSGGVEFRAGDEELKKQLKAYFGDGFVGELKEVLLDSVVRGFGYIYWYKDAKGRTRFQYADRMLSMWKEQNVQSTEDIAKLDEAYHKSKKNLGRPSDMDSASRRPVNRFNQFTQNTYDFEALEKKLLSN